MPQDPNDGVLVGLLSDALKQQNETNKDGFDRLESASAHVAKEVATTGAAAQRDFRIFAGVLLLGLLATKGVEFFGSVGDATIAVTPTAHASSIPEARNGNP